MRIALLIACVCPLLAFAQVNWTTLQKHSAAVLVYKTNAAAVERYIKQDSIAVDAYLSVSPYKVFAYNAVEEDALPKGQYVVIKVSDNKVIAYVTGITNLVVYPVNNQHRAQLLIRDKSSTDFITDARVWVNNKQAKYNSKAHSFEVRQKYPDEAIVKVYTPTDTAFFALSAKDDLSQSISEQRRNNFVHSRLFNALQWLPQKAISFFKGLPSNNIHGSGTIIFNQAKYKLTDTVKLKAYILNNKKLYKKGVNVYLNYYGNGAYIQQQLTQLQPSAPGAYQYAFPLSDTLPQDTRYTVSFQTSKKRQLLTNYFKLEDYLADEVANYQLRANKDEYNSSDTIHFFASATDANGLPLLDGTAKLVVTTQSVQHFYKDSLYVPDTLFTAEKQLATAGETSFDMPASYLPNADIAMNATVVFTNSNNETQEANAGIQYKARDRFLLVKQAGDSIVAEYNIHGAVMPADGYVLKSGDDLDDSIAIHYPVALQIDPLADSYHFYVTKNRTKLDSATLKITANYRPSFTNITRRDTIGFQLQNTYGIPISYTVFNGNTIVATGTGKDALIAWNTSHFNKHSIYTVKWQYWWAGEEQKGEDRMGYLYKALSITVQHAPIVFPGQKDSVQISVRDIHNKPAPAVNLTAVAYNNQFAKAVYVRSLPNLAKYRSKTTLLRDNFEMDDAYAVYKYNLGKHAGWMKPFALDTLPYYNMLMPRKEGADYVTPLANFNTEVSVHVVQKGEPQEVYLLYLNNELAYYNGVTDHMHDAYAVFPGYAKIGIRLYNQFIEIDSIYLQPFYKHDLFIDLDYLPAHSITQNTANYFTPDERHLLEKSIWRLADNYQTNNSYVWQQQRLFKLDGNRLHIVGPFIPNDSLHVYAPHNFDVHFRFEPGYEYTLSKQIERLEKKPLFPAAQSKIFLPAQQHTSWILGDTIPDKPVIDYTPPKPQPYLQTSYYNAYSNTGYGKLQFDALDTNKIAYTILYSQTQHKPYDVWAGKSYSLSNIAPGSYTLLLVNDAFLTAQTASFIITPNATLCLQEHALLFLPNNSILTEIIHNNTPVAALAPAPPSTIQSPVPEYGKGNATISGRVMDKKGGHGIAYAMVIIKGTSTGATTDTAGYFIIKNVMPGKCTLLVSAIGYAANEAVINAGIAQANVVYIQMAVSNMSLNEVVVVGYGVSRRKDLTGSVALISQGDMYVNAQRLQSRALGLMADSAPGSAADIVLRGIRSVEEAGKPIYIVDGIVYDQLPAFINPDMLKSATILNGTEAIAMYGARAADGAIVITTNGKTVRKQFRDYAIWQPQLFTNKEGKASFIAEYPDNITGWQLYVLGLDKKKRAGKTTSFIQSYKPLSAQLSMPQFLIEGDSAQAVGKLFNYTSDAYNITTAFTISDQVVNNAVSLQPKSSFIQHYPLYTSATKDNMTASFAINVTTGFKDAEERSIPVFKKGMEAATGQFYILQNDTTIHFTAGSGSNAIQLYAQNNTLQLLLEEVAHLKTYPYYCMEQTASKLRGLLMEKEIMQTLKQPFNEDKSITYLINKLQKSQLYDGGWSWWENGTADLHITNYVINALLPLRKDAAVENSIRNGLLYLQNRLAKQDKDALLQTLVTMSTAKHEMDYQPWLDKIAFDSLSQHQQWLYVQLKQQLGLEHQQELDTLLKHVQKNMLGSMHWGEQTWRWYNNTMASTVLAFQVLSKEPAYKNLLPYMVQYFLEQRKNGYWINTVESASVIAAILPYVLSQHEQFMQPAGLQVSGDTSFSIQHFPFKTSVSEANIKQLNIQKSGGGMTYFTLYQNSWNSAPKPVQDPFVVTTHFEKNNQLLNALQAGEKVMLKIEVEALKEADYVMIEVPIPAGCTYAAKPQNNPQMHTEYLKNKMVLFAEYLSQGKHSYEAELEVRYSGNYTLNPAKVSLMYFPTFYGNNGLKTVTIKGEK